MLFCKFCIMELFLLFTGVYFMYLSFSQEKHFVLHAVLGAISLIFFLNLTGIEDYLCDLLGAPSQVILLIELVAIIVLAFEVEKTVLKYFDNHQKKNRQ